ELYRKSDSYDSWNVDKIKWTDKILPGVSYSINNLLPQTNYSVYTYDEETPTISNLEYILTTDIDGLLPIFEIISGNINPMYSSYTIIEVIINNNK
ncbi:hypothetical protein GQ473_06775, partial [archaeon]|nr:hypothetical protein [archaeon]